MKTRAARLAACVGVTVLLALACNLPTSSTNGTTATESPTEAALSGPVSYTELLQEGIDSGEWTEGEGLQTLLGYFNGEVQAPEAVSSAQELDQDLTAILGRARQYVNENPKNPEIVEIERMLNSLVPDGDLLMPYAQELDSLSSLPAKLASPVYLPAQDWAACNELWQNGFPAPAPGAAPLICFDVYNFTAAGVTFRVFIDRDWLNIGVTRRLDLMRWASDALYDSAAVYSVLSRGGILPTDLIFNQLAHTSASGGTTQAEMAATHNAERTKCTIGTFPLSYSLNEQYFKQDVAHEMFHCFQFKEIFNLYDVNQDEILWWMEGSAEYFGNTVYPDYNEEYRRIDGLDGWIRLRNTFHLDYMNFLFFQNMANEYTSDRDVVNTLQRLPTEGNDSTFASALVNIYGSGTGDFFHRFGQGYLDYSIADTSGSNVPVHPQQGNVTSMLTANIFRGMAYPWQPSWFRLDFPEEYKYTLSISTEGEGQYSARSTGSMGGWGPLAAEVDAVCGSKEYMVLLSCTAPGATYDMEVEVVSRVHEDQEQECEEDCLPGLWKLKPDSFYIYMASILEGNSRLDSATADGMTINFDDLTGQATFTWDNGVVTQTKVGMGSENSQGTIVPDTQIVTAVSGNSVQTFDFTETRETGTGTITFGEPQGAYTTQIWMNGNNLGASTISANEFSWAALTSASYTCDEHELTLYLPFAGSPLVFEK